VFVYSILDHRSKQQFTCRIIHSLPLQMSAVQIFYKDKMVAVSHLIGSEQLPARTQARPTNEPIQLLINSIYRGCHNHNNSTAHLQCCIGKLEADANAHSGASAFSAGVEAEFRDFKCKLYCVM
jgi:hypothetical protein